MDLEAFKKWLPYYQNSFGGIISGVPTALAREMLKLCREKGVECELDPQGDGIWIVHVKGSKALK